MVSTRSAQELGNTVAGITVIDDVTPQVIPQIETLVTNLAVDTTSRSRCRAPFMRSSTSWIR